MAKATPPEGAGVLTQHRHRIENDKAYREAALTAPAPVRGKFLTNTVPTTGQADRSADAKKTEASKPQRDRPIDSDPGMSDETGITPQDDSTPE